MMNGRNWMSAALALDAAMGGFLDAGASDSDPAWSPSYFWMWNDRLDEAKLLSTLLGDRAVRARIKAAYPPSANYEPRHEPADFQNRESGLFGPVRIFE